jgi:hypothetical protein
MGVTVSLVSSQPLIGDIDPSAVLLISDGASTVQLDIETFFQVYDVLARDIGTDEPEQIDPAQFDEPAASDVLEYESAPAIAESPHRLRVRASVTADPE